MTDGVIDTMSYEFFLYLLAALTLTVLAFIIVFILKVLGTIPAQVSAIFTKLRITLRKIAAFLS